RRSRLITAAEADRPGRALTVPGTTEPATGPAGGGLRRARRQRDAVDRDASAARADLALLLALLGGEGDEHRGERRGDPLEDRLLLLRGLELRGVGGERLRGALRALARVLGLLLADHARVERHSGRSEGDDRLERRVRTGLGLYVK